jgi:hypothetical protein
VVCSTENQSSLCRKKEGFHSGQFTDAWPIAITG